MNKYIQKSIVPCYDTDLAWRMKPASFMNMAQEIANRHASELGFGYDDLITLPTYIYHHLKLFTSGILSFPMPMAIRLCLRLPHGLS